VKSIIEFQNQQFEVDFSAPIDISIPLTDAGHSHVAAFHLPDLKSEVVRAGGFTGSVAEGGSCNVNNIFFSPHGNGTHTECIGHITKEKYSVNDCLKEYFFSAMLITIAPEKSGNDSHVTAEQVKKSLGKNIPEALIIRTLPNDVSKRERNYSGTNPPFIDQETAAFICSLGIKHLLIDLPSMDKENDGGKLLAHHSFWNYPSAPRINSTITELIYVPDKISDGFYFLNLQFAAFDSDASPSRPVLFQMKKM
jgi:kynurenine formamidase